MSRLYSLSFLTVQEASPVEAVEIAAAWGYDFVGLRILPAASGEAVTLLLHDAKLLREVQAALRDTGVKVADVEIVRLKDSATVALTFSLLWNVLPLWARRMCWWQVMIPMLRVCKTLIPIFAIWRLNMALSADLEFMPWTAVKTAPSPSHGGASGAANVRGC